MQLWRRRTLSTEQELEGLQSVSAPDQSSRPRLSGAGYLTGKPSWRRTTDTDRTLAQVSAPGPNLLQALAAQPEPQRSPFHAPSPVVPPEEDHNLLRLASHRVSCHSDGNERDVVEDAAGEMDAEAREDVHRSGGHTSLGEDVGPGGESQRTLPFVEQYSSTWRDPAANVVWPTEPLGEPHAEDVVCAMDDKTETWTAITPEMTTTERVPITHDSRSVGAATSGKDFWENHVDIEQSPAVTGANLERDPSAGMEQSLAEYDNLAPGVQSEPVRGPYEYTRQAKPHQHSFSDGGPASLYSRAIKQRALAAARALEVQRQLEQDTMQDCTFSPKINRSSAHILRHGALYRLRTRRKQDGRKVSRELAEQLSSPDGPDHATRANSPVTKSERRGLLLYAEALRSRQKHEAYVQKTLQEEVESFQSKAARPRPLSPAIYGQQAVYRAAAIHSRSASPTHRDLQHLDPDCTFRPATNPRRGEAAFEGLLASPRSSWQGLPHDLFKRPVSAPPDGPDLEGSPERHVRRPQSAAGQSLAPPKSVIRARSSLKAVIYEVADIEKQALRAPSPRWGASTRLNFSEFLSRQQRFLQDRDERVNLRRSAEAALLAGPDTKLCPGTLRILTRLPARSDTPGADSEVDGDTLRSHPLQDEAGSHDGGAGGGSPDSRASASSPSPLGLSARAARHAAEAEAELTFSPAITARGAARTPRSLHALSEGDRLRRECYLEQRRLEALIAEERELTFRPRIKRVAGVASRLALRRLPGAFLLQAREKARHREQQALRAMLEKEEQEMAECSFSPRTRRLPSFIRHMTRGKGTPTTPRSPAVHTTSATALPVGSGSYAA